MPTSLEPFTKTQMIRLMAGRTIGSSVLASAIVALISYIFPQQDLTWSLSLAVAVPFVVTPFLSWRTAAALRDMRAAQIEAAKLAQTDPLTGLPNRRAFFQADERLRATAPPDLSRALMFIDIDHFKRINDRHGHEGGDAVIRSLAARLLECLHADDDVARIGGEEFVVQFRDRSVEDALRIAAKLGAAARNDDVAFRGSALHYTVSIGIASGTLRTPIDRLLSAADAQLYLAKNAGRDCIYCENAIAPKDSNRSARAA